MTAEEERLLKAYLGAYGEIESADDNAGFYDWYMKRYEGGEDERNYKHTLDLARVWASRYTAGILGRLPGST